MTRSSSSLAPVVLAALWLTGCATPPGPGPDEGLGLTAVPKSESAISTDLANQQAEFSVQLWSDQPPPRLGDFLSLRLRASADSYLSLYAIHASGRTTRLLDNQAVRGGQTLIFPSANSPVDFQFSPPPGTETYLLLATQQPLRWLAPADIRRPGALTELNFTGSELQQRLRTVLARQNPYSWNGAVLNLSVQP